MIKHISFKTTKKYKSQVGKWKRKKIKRCKPYVCKLRRGSEEGSNGEGRRGGGVAASNGELGEPPLFIAPSTLILNLNSNLGPEMLLLKPLTWAITTWCCFDLKKLIMNKYTLSNLFWQIFRGRLFHGYCTVWIEWYLKFVVWLTVIGIKELIETKITFHCK